MRLELQGSATHYHGRVSIPFSVAVVAAVVPVGVSRDVPAAIGLMGEREGSAADHDTKKKRRKRVGMVLFSCTLRWWTGIIACSLARVTRGNRFEVAAVVLLLLVAMLGGNYSRIFRKKDSMRKSEQPQDTGRKKRLSVVGGSPKLLCR